MLQFKRQIFAPMVFWALFLTLIISWGVMTPPAFAQEAQSEGTSYVQPSGAEIRDIQVVGVERIEPATVLSYLDIKVGDRMTQETLDTAIKSLFNTGLFADVTLRQKGSNTLEVTVVENPVINEIAFEGNDKLKDEELQSEITLRPRQVYTRTKVQ
ncbi:MAG: outer membrane protein assembly factor YaeT precursor, partial [Micavibrio sp.]|nr:outer membrane protein assembly factor YaeT precursor [Micavibrio sp.]